MTPYYADDAVTIYHADCREWMPAADAILTDSTPAEALALRAALERLLAVAMTEEEDVSAATQDEWIAAIQQANEALDQ